MYNGATFDIEEILTNLQRSPIVTIVDKRLVCSRKRNDLVFLMRQLLKSGYRRLKPEDLKVGTVLLALNFFQDFFESEKPNEVQVFRVRITEIRTPEEMRERRERLAQEDPEMAVALAPFGLPKENMYVLVLDGKRVEPREIYKVDQKFGQLSRSILLDGGSFRPVSIGQKPEVLSDVFLVKK